MRAPPGAASAWLMASVIHSSRNGTFLAEIGKNYVAKTKFFSVSAKNVPFRLEWLTDAINQAEAAPGGALKGFSVKYWQNSC